MWALRRAGNPLRTSALQVASVRGCASLDVLLSADTKNAEHCDRGCLKSCCCRQPKPSVCQSSFSSGSFMWNRTFSSQAGANSGDKEEDLEDGFSDLEVPPEADKKDAELTSEESSDEDAADAVDLLEVDDADSKSEKEPKKKISQCPLLKVMLEAPWNDVSGTLKKWVNDGNTVDRSDVFFAVLNLRRRRFFSKALQLLEWLEESKLIELVERDYASRLDLMAKVHGIYKAEKFIDNIPASLRGEIVYRTLLANCVAEVNVKKAEEVFNKMKDLGFPVTVFAINQLLLLYKRVDKKKISDVLTMMEKEDVKPSLFTYKLLVDTKGASRDIEGMEKVVQSMEAEGITPDLLLQATIAKHYIFGGHREKAEAILESMEGDMKENRNACKMVMPLYAFLGKKDDVERIWKVCQSNTRLDECLSAIEAFGRLGDVEKAEEVFGNMFKTWKTLSSKYYNAMMRVYANQNLMDKGKELAKRMEEDGCRLGISTLDSLVKLYVDAGEVEKAESLLHKLSVKNKMKPQYSSYLMLLDSYSKIGDVHNSEKVFSKLRQMGYNGRIRQYQLLLHAYLHAKAPVYGFRERMKADNIFPNSVIASLLAATDPFNKKKSISDILE
ncbi:pentatricopeptide repeat-containing protein At1g80270, mitochondrial [Brachypodium distachyon]|uniref:PROP1-like PPR domain-containing protein n=1 Tax=Brachypodium distachyon TaxID=15368 RepID=I1HEL1_BRADI|nr:pentatricopeptide repeat-containing protein At1g80270, mitochondrial [Brachypodium distachyon]KQK03956.1 hypothetical protein BRADI_2g10850v3 [Brachypodium distachyon]|eukprot:XP_003567340.1 pentatricopeptide repeat-containing protein At1g80270, mitochondrial [Brachypodium distachyon]